MKRKLRTPRRRHESSMSPILRPESPHTVGCGPVVIAAISDRKWPRGDIRTCSDACNIDSRVVATVDTGVIVVARDEKCKVPKVSIIVRGETERRSFGENFSPIIDVDGIRQLVAVSRLNQRCRCSGRYAFRSAHRFSRR